MARLSEYLPSRQFQAVALSVVGAFALVVFASKLADNPNVVPEEQKDFEANISTSTLVAITQKIIESNSDWESVVASTTLVKNVGHDSTNTPLTATDIVARDLFAKYLAVKQGGGKLDSKTEEELIQSVLTSTDLTPKYRMYTEGEIIIGPDDSTSTIREYGNMVGEIMKRNTVSNTNPILIMQTALDKNDPNTLKQLDEKIIANKKVISDVLKLKVPPSALMIHKDFINASSNAVETLTSMKNVFTDPITAIFATSNFLNMSDNMKNSIDQSKQYFSKKGIVYEKTDTGYYFTNY